MLDRSTQVFLKHCDLGPLKSKRKKEGLVAGIQKFHECETYLIDWLLESLLQGSYLGPNYVVKSSIFLKRVESSLALAN